MTENACRIYDMVAYQILFPCNVKGGRGFAVDIYKLFNKIELRKRVKKILLFELIYLDIIKRISFSGEIKKIEVHWKFIWEG